MHTCYWCGVDVKDKRHYRRVKGWVINRKDGGVNHVRDQRATGEVACLTCVDRIAAGVSPQQEVMFE